jgi:tetratricopeptide (TPR) repeat protein
MDPNNPVVKLCVEGMAAEEEGRFAEAQALFLQAWARRQDDFEACVAAHFVARQQDSPAAMLRWNQTALHHAEAVGDERVQGFYPSLYLNLGWSYEQIGDLAGARRCYELAARRLDDAPGGTYGEVVQKGIALAQQRIQTPGDQT